MAELRFFLDRSLGDALVPTALRDAGWNVVTMRERYGPRAAQQLADVDWIAEATAAGEVLLTGDKMIAKRPLEARTVTFVKARVFALGNSQLTGPEKAERFLVNETKIFHRAERTPAPYVVSVNAQGLETLKLFL